MQLTNEQKNKEILILEQRKTEFTKKEFSDKKENDQYKDYINLFDESFDIDNLKFFKLAVLLGYNDTKRTLKGIGQLWKENSENKNDFLKKIATEIQNIFKNYSVKIDRDFDREHNKLCQTIRNNTLFKNTSVHFTYGHAQKIVNMAFKYLSCMNGSEKYEDIFQKCHMPLDSYTLEWYKRSDFYSKVGKDARVKSDDTWSKMTETQYCAIAKAIKENVNGEPFFVYDTEISLPYYPLYAEFIIWPEMQLNMAAEDFISSYSDEPKDDKKELKEKNLQCKLERIEEIIKEYKLAFPETKTE